MIAYEDLLKQTKPYRTLINDRERRELCHCYMIVAEDALACKGLCFLAARLLLCKHNDCGECSDCIRVEDLTHSALYVLSDLKAEGVRNLIERSYYAANEGDKKVIVIERMDQIDPKVQNFMLKTLEEPSEGVIFVLGAVQPANVLDTIKSRAKKLFCEALDPDGIAEQLIAEGYREDIVERAVACCFGSLSKAAELAGDNDFVTRYAAIVGILRDMQTSKQLDHMLLRLNLKEGELSKYLDILEIIVKAMLDLDSGLPLRGFEELKEIAASFNRASLVNVSDLLLQCRRKINSHCRQEAVADSLLMGILEVKYKCR